MTGWLQVVEPDGVLRRVRRPIDAEAMESAIRIVEEVRRRGESALREHSERFGDIEPGGDLYLDRDRLDRALDSLGEPELGALQRATERVRHFAVAQRDSIQDLDMAVPGGRAGHNWIPVDAAGAYAPGGRYPLPSSVLMTVAPAKVAGVESVWVASPRPSPITLAAAALAGADGLLAVGGAQAIAALAFGIGCPPCDVVVGPGNRWVTAAKKVLYGEVGIDGLAGPSEIVVLADGSADPQLVAADLIAQAEHDVAALPILVTTDEGLRQRVETEISKQLEDLDTADVAIPALGNGFSVVVECLDLAIAVSDQIAPEHLALHVADAESVFGGLHNYGSAFVGGVSAEVFADYGIGPNHVLPTGRGARFQSGLSVMSFLRAPTWLRLVDPGAVLDDAATLARVEGLEGHARAAETRLPPR